jgi:hypothetical protein
MLAVLPWLWSLWSFFQCFLFPPHKQGAHSSSCGCCGDSDGGGGSGHVVPHVIVINQHQKTLVCNNKMKREKKNTYGPRDIINISWALF